MYIIYSKISNIIALTVAGVNVKIYIFDIFLSSEFLVIKSLNLYNADVLIFTMQCNIIEYTKTDFVFMRCD